MISDTTVRTLGLPVWDNEAVTMRDINTVSQAPIVHVGRLTIGSARAYHVTFAELIGDGATGEGAPRLNLFGDDFLSRYDVELDLPHDRIGLFDEQGSCGANFTPYDEPVVAVPILTFLGDQPLMVASLDGHQIPFVLDSGSSVSFINFKTAAKIGILRQAIRRDPRLRIFGAEGRITGTLLHRFGSLRVGSDVASPVYAEIGSAPINLLGSDWLKTRRVWLSLRQHEMLIAR